MQHAEVGHDNFVKVPIDSSKESSKCLHASQESQGNKIGEGPITHFGDWKDQDPILGIPTKIRIELKSLLQGRSTGLESACGPCQNIQTTEGSRMLRSSNPEVRTGAGSGGRNVRCSAWRSMDARYNTLCSLAFCSC